MHPAPALGGAFSIGGALPVPTPQPQPKKFGVVRQGYITLVDTAITLNGFWALASLASSINKAVGVAFSHLKAGSDAAAVFLKHVTDACAIAFFFNSIKGWVKGEYTRTMQKVSQVFMTVRAMAASTLFLAEQGAFSLAKIAITIGQLPVFNLVTSSLLSLGMIFSTADNYKEYKRISRTQIEFKAIIANRDGEATLEQVTRAEEGLKANQIRLNIMKFDTIRNIATVAFQALMILGMATGWGALALTGAFLLTYSIVNSTTWVCSAFLNQKYVNVKEAASPSTFFPRLRLQIE